MSTLNHQEKRMFVNVYVCVCVREMRALRSATELARQIGKSANESTQKHLVLPHSREEIAEERRQLARRRAMWGAFRTYICVFPRFSRVPHGDCPILRELESFPSFMPYTSLSLLGCLTLPLDPSCFRENKEDAIWDIKTNELTELKEEIEETADHATWKRT